jgi:hypothetical protein
LVNHQSRCPETSHSGQSRFPLNERQESST